MTQAELPESLPEVKEMDGDLLGEPLNVKQVAKLIGCSAWSVRQRLIPMMGLPHFRSGPSGKLVFFKEQVIRWILQKQIQQKGGNPF
jgi:hypothetical protein